jgi:GntR family transcriptional regulator
MMMTIEPSSFVPIYEQIKTEIKSRISLGTLRPDEPLPSIRDLAGELVVNPNTVARAYRELEREGFITTRKGKASFVAGDSKALVLKEKQRLLGEIFERALGEALKFGFTSEEIEEAFEESLKANRGQLRGEGK